MQASLNHTYRLVWSDVLNAFVAVAECVRGRGKGSGRKKSRLSRGLLSGAVLLSAAAAAHAQLPTGGEIVGGSGSIASSGNSLTVTQTSERMAANWQSFSIGQGHSVNFVQPSSSSVALNRVLGSDVSVIQGALNANGQIFLVNPNGVLFSPTAQVNVGAIVASTLNISTQDFMAGNYRFEGASSNAIINQGNISARGNGQGGGSIALIAARIENTGSLSAHAGHVLMGAGNRVRLDLGGPVKIEVEEGALNALIEQGGAIRADGGLVYLTARAAGDLVTTVINHSGITEAQTLATGESGQIYLMGDMRNGRIEVAGTLDASAPNGGDGGFVETSAAVVQIDPQVHVTTLSSFGDTGTWLIDPTNFTISPGSAAQTDNGIGADTLSTALNSNNVIIQTVATGSGNGDIFVNAAVTKTSGPATTLTLAAHRNINVTRLISGSGGHALNVVLAARAFGGDAGHVNISGGGIRTYGGNITIGGGDTTASGFAINLNNLAGVRIQDAVIDATGDGSGAADATLPTATSGGNITIRGKGNSTFNGAYQWGVQTQNNVAIVTGGSGSISIEGRGGNGQAAWAVGSVGVVLEDGSFVKANTGSITIRGYAGSGGDRYGIASTESNKLIGTNGQLLFEGDSLLIRNATLTIFAGQDSDIKMPIVGCSDVDQGCDAFTFEKRGPGILNLWGNAEHWDANRPGDTVATSTNGIFTDAGNRVNVVAITADQALFAFGTRPTTVNVVEQSSAAVIGGSGGGVVPPAPEPTPEQPPANPAQPIQNAIANAQQLAAAPAATDFGLGTGAGGGLDTAALGLNPVSFVATPQPDITLSGGLQLVQTDQVPEGAGPLTQSAGVDPSGFMRVFVVRGGINVPEWALAAEERN